MQRNEAILQSKDTPETDTLYHWVHHSCAMWTSGTQVTPNTPVKMDNIPFKEFEEGCVICARKGFEVGATVKCYKPGCNIRFHVECAKRNNYCMEVERKVTATSHSKNCRERIYKVFCESHRPFKIVQELAE